MPPRRSRIEERLAERGFTYDRTRRVAIGPGPRAPEFSRRQVDKLLDVPGPFEARDDAEYAGAFRRSHRGEVLAENVVSDRRLAAALTIIHHDEAQPGQTRTEVEAKRLRWALARIYGTQRVAEWTQYIHRRER